MPPAADNMKMELGDHVADGSQIDLVAAQRVRQQAGQDHDPGQQIGPRGGRQLVPLGLAGFDPASSRRTPC